VIHALVDFGMKFSGLDPRGGSTAFGFSALRKSSCTSLMCCGAETRPIVRTIIIFSLAVMFTAVCFAAPEARVFIIPLYPVEQTLSEEMRLRVAGLEKDDAFRALSATWDRLTELPSWVFKPEKCEIAYVFGNPMVIHGYRYAVIADGNNKLIIVRAGGLDGSYEIFVPKRKSEKKAAAVRLRVISHDALAGG
jgi:hypothetical protein